MVVGATHTWPIFIKLSRVVGLTPTTLEVVEV